MSVIQTLFYNNPSSRYIAGGVPYIPGNGYRYHVFLEPGNFFILNGPVTVEVLIVAGGGAGGTVNYMGGGGGAGGVRNITSIPLSDGYYPISVGLGGIVGSNGNPSSAFGYTATGGGQGSGQGSPVSLTVYPGGSGGGGVYGPPTLIPPAPPVSSRFGLGNDPPTTPSQGNPGGFGSSPLISGIGGGGGGAGASGSNSTTNSIFAPGGPGSPIPEYAAPLFPGMPSNWITAVGPIGLFGGGGGGGSNSTVVGNSAGGSGGGGRGAGRTPPPSVDVLATPGINYTGGGGGGKGRSSPAGSGGSGIVIVRYLNS